MEHETNEILSYFDFFLFRKEYDFHWAGKIRIQITSQIVSNVYFFKAKLLDNHKENNHIFTTFQVNHKHIWKLKGFKVNNGVNQ